MNGIWYGKHSDVEGKPFGGLAVIVPLLKRMGVEEIIDQHLPVDDQADFAHGTILSVLIAARAHKPVALSNIAQWAQDTFAHVVFDMPLEKRNDDRFGRSLDAFFEQRHSILSTIALRVVEVFRVQLQDLHYDPTHILFTGVYEQAQAREGAADVLDGDRVDAARLDPANVSGELALGRAPERAANYDADAAE